MMVWLGDPGPIHRLTYLILTEFYQYGQLYLWGSDRKGIIGPCHWTRKKVDRITVGGTSVKSTLAICPWLKQFHENRGVLWKKTKYSHPYISFSLRSYVGNTKGCVPIQAAREELRGYGGFSSLKSSLLWRWTGWNFSENIRDSGQFGAGHS